MQKQQRRKRHKPLKRTIITNDTKTVTLEEQTEKDRLLDENTILMSINGTIGNLAWYKNEKLMLGKSVAYIIVSTFEKNFVYYYLQIVKIMDYFLTSLTGTTIKNLGLKAIGLTKLNIPKTDEQEKIGDFFKKLDKLIEQRSKKQLRKSVSRKLCAGNEQTKMASSRSSGWQQAKSYSNRP